MKRTLILVIAFLVGISLAGCGSDNHQDNPSNQKRANSSNADNLEKQKGIVASIKDPKNQTKITLMPNTTRTLISIW